MKILFIDFYDSFTYNLVALIRATSCHPSVTVVSCADVTPAHLSSFSVVVLGPGPGSPLIESDMGALQKVWSVLDSLEHPPVVIGVCLGFQWLMLQHGHAIELLPAPRHGLISHLDITDAGKSDMYANTPDDIACVRYHSLYVDYKPNTGMVPLAWSRDLNELGAKVLMAARHRTKPYWGVQYHPESICSTFGNLVFENVLGTVMERTDVPPSIHNTIQEQRSNDGHCLFQAVLEVTCDMTALITQLCNLVMGNSTFALLESAAEPGSWSYIGCNPDLVLTYKIPDKHVKINNTDVAVTSIDDVWGLAASRLPTVTHFSQSSLATYLASPERPTFHGGMIGYVSYEAGVVDGLGLSVDSESPAEVPDIELVLYTHSIAVNHKTGKVYVHELSLARHGSEWIKSMTDAISLIDSQLNQSKAIGQSNSLDSNAVNNVTLPSKDVYLSKIARAKSHLDSGDSYELCVTDQTVISQHNSGISDWDFYQHLRKINPAPYSSFIRTASTTLLGLSPERFLRWDNNSRECELRPIKGTVARSVPLSTATEILKSRKEQAENLMIVDLIRHDLSRFCDDVTVPQLMAIETYETVYQLVSVITGHMNPAVNGINVLRGCLPPGSMTGAPKRRSVEILRDIEAHKRRSLYSGVHGYWDVLGHGDWSVVIRSLYSVNREHEREWRIGAGGAITALSVPEEEWSEMKVKLNSALNAFQRTRG